jgi:DNA-binding CsgD family transcriptional regulator
MDDLTMVQGDTSFNDTIDSIDQIQKKSEFEIVLADTLERYRLKSLAFMGFNIGALNKGEPDILVTYSQEWINHYRSRDYLEVDPVVHQGLKSILPVDWSNFDRRDAKVRALFSESREAGLGNQGLSIPVRGRHGDMSLFSLTCEANEQEWSALKRNYIRDFQTLAVFFHQSVLRTYTNSEIQVQLTPREAECLHWAACGKTSEETAMILGLTRRGVRYHIENIIFKLNAVNLAHAVAKGIHFRIINPPR